MFPRSLDERTREMCVLWQLRFAGFEIWEGEEQAELRCAWAREVCLRQ